jgi:hypothetical protein
MLFGILLLGRLLDMQLAVFIMLGQGMCVMPS